MGASQRNKGAAGEREALDIFSRFYGRKFKRHLGQARDGGDDAEVGPFIVEVKRRKRLTGLMSWYRQVLDAYVRKGQQARRKGEFLTGMIPVVVMREDKGEWMAMVSLNHLLRISEDWVVPQLPEPTIEDLL